MSYFLETYSGNINRIEAKLELCNYVTKSNLKNLADANT